VGAIAAGQPLPVPESGTWEGMTPLDTLELPESLVGRRENLFALRVRGLSMIDALIDDGDIVVLEPPRRLENGDMVAVWLKVEQEATLKHLYDEGNRIRLQPANRQMAPLYTSRDNVEVQGRVVAVFRQLR
jgi:repressor LexA